MTDLMPFIVLGLISGAVYGISALGLVLTYKATGIFNFAHGALSAVAAFAFYSLHFEAGITWPIALLVTVGGTGIVAGLLLERLGAALQHVPTLHRVVGTIGLLVAVRSLIVLVYGPEARAFAPFLSQSRILTLGGVGITVEDVVTLALGIAAAVGTVALFRRTTFGLFVRGVVDDPDLMSLNGVAASRIRRRAWILGSLFAAGSGVLFASVQQQVQVDVLTLLIVQAFGAAAIGAFRSMPLAFVGGLGVGVSQQVIGRLSADQPALVGLDINVPFLVLFVLLLVSRRGYFVELGRRIRTKAAPLPSASRGAMLGASILIASVAAVPALDAARITVWATALSQVVLFLSLGLLIRVSGQISLCHIGFAAIGAASFGQILGTGVPWFLALLLAGLVAVPVGILIAVPAIRLSNLYLALATLGFGILLAQFFYTKSFMFGFGQQLAAPRPSAFTSDTAYFYLLLALAMVGALVVATIQRSRLGRLLRGVADDPEALTTLGASTRVTLTLVFGISAGLAAISGATFSSIFGNVGGFSFPATQSITILAVLVVAGRGVLQAAALAPILLTVVPAYLPGGAAADVVQVLFGIGAILTAVAAQESTQVGGGVTDWMGRWGDRGPGPASRGSYDAVRSRREPLQGVSA